MGYFHHRKTTKFGLSLLVQTALLSIALWRYWGGDKRLELLGRDAIFVSSVTIMECEGAGSTARYFRQNCSRGFYGRRKQSITQQGVNYGGFSP
jgi:hypothetical protein